jgi:hypothetical protein
MGLLPTHGNETRLIQQPQSLEAPASPLSSRPKRSGVERSAVFSRVLAYTL